jgi:hypothetical protein
MSQAEQKTAKPPAPAPVQRVCEFPDCGDQACYRRTPPGSHGMRHGPDVWICRVHEDAAPAMLEAKLRKRDIDNAAEITAAAARRAGKLV